MRLMTLILGLIRKEVFTIVLEYSFFLVENCVECLIFLVLHSVQMLDTQRHQTFAIANTRNEMSIFPMK